MAAPLVLLYHRVCADDAWRPSDYVVTASVFREQMQYLVESHHYTPRLSEVLGWWGRAPRTDRTPVVITFDDGYAELLENVVPVLRDLGLTAAVFPVLDLDRRFNAWDADPALRDAPLLRPDDMRALEAAGLELGSHTVTHPRLTRATDRQLADELRRSREVLASIVAHPLPVLAYPYGDVDARVKRATADAGYAAALAVNSGPLDPGSDPFEIRRVCVTNSAGAGHMRFVLWGEKLYRWSRWKVRTGFASSAPWHRRTPHP